MKIVCLLIGIVLIGFGALVALGAVVNLEAGSDKWGSQLFALAAFGLLPLYGGYRLVRWKPAKLDRAPCEEEPSKDASGDNDDLLHFLEAARCLADEQAPEQKRHAAAKHLGKAGGSFWEIYEEPNAFDAAYELLGPLIGSHQPWVKAAAIAGLGDMLSSNPDGELAPDKLRRLAEAILKQLGSPDAEVAAACATALGWATEYASSPTRAKISEELVKRVMLDGSPLVCPALASLPLVACYVPYQSALIDKAIELLSHEEEDVRERAENLLDDAHLDIAQKGRLRSIFEGPEENATASAGRLLGRHAKKKDVASVLPLLCDGLGRGGRVSKGALWASPRKVDSGFMRLVPRERRVPSRWG